MFSMECYPISSVLCWRRIYKILKKSNNQPPNPKPRTTPRLILIILDENRVSNQDGNTVPRHNTPHTGERQQITQSEFQRRLLLILPPLCCYIPRPYSRSIQSMHPTAVVSCRRRRERSSWENCELNSNGPEAAAVTLCNFLIGRDEGLSKDP